jgi:hypothetical protein
MRVNGGLGSRPRLASGTADSGVYGGASGIPAVLHPNEAVVPLPNGQSIPVSMGGSMEAVYQCLEDIKRIMATTHQSVVNVGVIFKNESDRHFDVLKAINNGIYKIVDRGLGAGSGGSSSYGSSGGGSGGGTGSGALDEYMSTLTRLQIAYQKAVDEYASSGSSQSFSWALQSSNHGPFKQYRELLSEIKVLYSNLSSADKSQADKSKGKNTGFTSQDFGGRMGLIRNDIGFGVRNGNDMRGGLPFFSSGSPNAWKDAMGVPTDVTGGFLATLHKDEAVIPLPDGRSVPVDLSVVGPQKQAPVSGGRSGRAAVTVQNNITVHIETPDAASFNRSQDQIMRTLSAKIDRATRNIGVELTDDDPTLRASGRRRG